MIINTINKKLGKFDQNNSLTLSPQHNKYSLSPSKLYQLSVYKQLELPRLKDRELKKSSVYSSLELLNMYKQRQKLKYLINEEENQKYLQQYFRKQKILNKQLKMLRNYSLGMGEMKNQLERYNNSNNKDKYSKKLSTEQSIESPLLLSARRNNNKLNSSNDKNYYSAKVILRNNLSLPRMKFN